MQNWHIFKDGKLYLTQLYPCDMTKAEILESLQADTKEGQVLNAVKAH